MPFDSQRAHLSPTGAKLNVYSRKVDGGARGVIQINHGLAEHALRYARFADHMAGIGFHVYAHDHRGHGYTEAPDAPQGMFAPTGGREKVIADVASVHDLIASEHPGLPVIVFGHSMGGMITANFILKHSDRLQGAAICNSNVNGGMLERLAQLILRYERFRLGSDVPSRILPKLTFQAWGKAVPNHRTLFDWLSRDPVEVDKYVADPLCGWDASVSMWGDIFDLSFNAADNRNFADIRRDFPLYLVGGEKDPATNGGKAIETLARRMQAMGFSNVSSKIYAGTRHESLNEINRDQVTEDFAIWAGGIARG